MCRREIYRIKATVHHTLLKLTAALVPSSPPTEVERLRQCLDLFDHILVEEYSEDTLSMARPSENAHTICDFCGSDIFQSYWECSHCVQGPSAPIGEGFALCSRCYVDGRSCSCNELVPVQCVPFESLLIDRRRAVHALEQGHCSSQLISEESVFLPWYSDATH